MARSPGEHPKADQICLRFCLAFMSRGPELLLSLSEKKNVMSKKLTAKRGAYPFRQQDKADTEETWLANEHGRPTGYFFPYPLDFVLFHREVKERGIHCLSSSKHERGSILANICNFSWGTELFMSESQWCLLHNVNGGWIPGLVTTSRQRLSHLPTKVLS